MLSYQHGYHAGNFADVLKHLVLIELLDHLCKKDKAFSYIDTHAGSALYPLDNEKASKTGEYLQGIRKVEKLRWPELERYQQLIASFNNGPLTNSYPGSPLLALRIMRKQDRAWLYELHPEESQVLQRHVDADKRAQVMRSNGYKGLQEKLPPPSRRGLALIDPSYEVKSDYTTTIEAVLDAHRRFATGIFAIWYPVVLRSNVDAMTQRLIKSGIRNIQRFELGIAADSTEFGMTASGMLVINPTYGLLEKMQLLLPRLATVVTESEVSSAMNGTSIAEVLVDE